MRIVTGRFRGRTLATLKGDATRPTSDRVRQAIFNILEHGIEDFSIEGARVLDLFAGTGALGLESLSRGARFCLFVEESAEARAVIRRNVEAMALTGITKIWRRDATRLGPAGTLQPFDLVFLDPPYGRGLGEAALASARAGGWIRPAGLIVLEEHADAQLALPDGFAEIDRRRWGDTQVLFARAE
jgi:16S rRNA (guanine966-N2)-methyltransferase